jgi:hypothetical protein
MERNGKMKILELNRVGENDNTTFGVLSKITYGNKILPICNILENSWQDNKADISCIPKGVYSLQRGPTTKATINGETFQITGVPRRTSIKFHIGNTHLDTLGCPLTVSSFGRLTIEGSSILGGYKSRVAFSTFMEVMGEDEEATLIVN